MPDQIAQAFSVTNLHRCWRWIRSSTEASYKNYFRHIYNAYELGIDRNLPALSKQLRSGSFKPTFAAKLYLPKASGLLRPWTLLSVEDQLVYLAAVSLIAGRLLPRFRRNYLKTVYGNLYAGKTSDFFYKDWRKCYRSYTRSIRKAYATGHHWTASFDLTACFDSIDHRLLRDRLTELGIDVDLSDTLLKWLCLWTAHDHHEPIFTGHGIPQGPLASGFLSEVVLSYFDTAPRSGNIIYLRYVDDIRLFGTNELSIRQQIVALDLQSKRIGLFPQSSKIRIHSIQDIEQEIKSVSNPPEDIRDSADRINQALVLRRLKQLSYRLTVTDETRFKYVLASALPCSELTIRLLRILERHPHLHGPICRHLESVEKLGKTSSREAMALLRSYTLYPAFTASLIRAMRGRLHRDYAGVFTKHCHSRLKKNARDLRDPELRAALASVTIASGRAKWKEVERLANCPASWWVRAELLRFVQVDFVGPATSSRLVNTLLRDTHPDPACVAAEVLLSHGMELERPYKDVHPAAQHALRSAKYIGRVLRTDDPVRDELVAMLGSSVQHISWRKLLTRHYKPATPIARRLNVYARSDATSWVNLLDTFMDLTLDCLFAHDQSLGRYQLGNIGGSLNAPTGRLSRSYPQFYRTAQEVHDLRLQSDLSHPVTKKTGRPTRFIRFKEISRIQPLVRTAFFELWSAW